jgi:predicted Zn-dependent protease
MSRLTILLLVLVMPVVGCSSSAPIDRWVVAQGGIVRDPRLDRAHALAAALCERHHDLQLELAVLDRDDVSAFSWPAGYIFVSRGMVDALDDTALSAAIAHEMADVLNHRRAGLAGLRRGEARLTEEVWADRVGVRLMVASGLPRDAMPRMLQDVLRHGDLPPQVQADLRHRVEMLHQFRHVD